MKSVLYGLAAGILSMLYACEKKEIIFEGPYHVRFTEPTGAARESYSKVIPISVHLVGPHLAQSVVVKYTVGGNAREGIDYQIEGKDGVVGEVVIPAGQSFGNINLKLINNSNNILESQNLTFTLIEVSPANLNIGMSKGGIIGRTMNFTIIDDCILSGSYTGRSDYTEVAVPEISITSTDCQTYTLTNWNIGILSLSGIKLDLTFIDNGDNTLTIPPQPEDILQLANDTLQGTGSVNPVNGRLTFNVELRLATSADTDTTIFFPFEYIPER